MIIGIKFYCESLQHYPGTWRKHFWFASNAQYMQHLNWWCCIRFTCHSWRSDDPYPSGWLAAWLSDQICDHTHWTRQLLIKNGALDDLWVSVPQSQALWPPKHWHQDPLKCFAALVPVCRSSSWQTSLVLGHIAMEAARWSNTLLDSWFPLSDKVTKALNIKLLLQF